MPNCGGEGLVLVVVRRAGSSWGLGTGLRAHAGLAVAKSDFLEFFGCDPPLLFNKNDFPNKDLCFGNTTL